MTPSRTAGRFPQLQPLLWACLLLPVGCGAEPEAPVPVVSGPPVAPSSTSKDVRQIRIGAVLPTFSQPFFVAQKKALEAKAEVLHVSIDVRDGQNDDQAQLKQVADLLNLGCDALILCPRDEDALIPAVEAANRVRVPVILLNRRINGGRVACFVGADDTEGGKAQAEALADALGPGGGPIVYLQGLQGSSPQRLRSEGFRAALSDHPKIKIADDRFADFESDRAKAIMTGLTRRFKPGQIRAIVAQSDEMALPAAEAARAAGWKNVIVIGFDGTSAAFGAILSGTMHATILQDPAEQAEKAVEAAVDQLRGKFVLPEQITSLPVITKENAFSFQAAY
jgi:ribose transport system substrate-binding protein